MKKALLLFIPFLFLSCFSYNIDNVYITNKSSEVVSFTYDNETITLSPGDIHFFEYASELKVTNTSKDQRVYFNFDSYKNKERFYSFNDIQPVTYRIYNPLNETIIISEKNNKIGKPLVKNVTISAGDIVEINVYTDNPIFIGKYENKMPVDNSLFSIVKL